MHLGSGSRVIGGRPHGEGAIGVSLLTGSCVLLLLLAHGAAALGMSEPTPLQAGIPFKSRLVADQPAYFEFEAEAGNAYLVEVDQGGLDFVLTVESPDGSSRSYNSPLFRDDREVAVIDAIAGSYRIKLLSREYSGAIAQAEVVLSVLSGNTPRETAQAAGLRLLTEAAHANQLASVDGWSQSLQACEKAAILFDTAGDGLRAARSLFCAANIEYWHLSQWDRAAELAQRASSHYEAGGDSRLAANAVHLQAASLVEKALEIEKSESSGLAPEALALFDQSLTLLLQAEEMLQGLGFSYDAARVTNNVGYTYLFMERYDEAINYFDRAAEQFRGLEEWQDEMNPLSNRGVIHFKRANLIDAVATWQRLLELLPPDKDLRSRADMLDNLAAAQVSLHQLTEALQSYSLALQIHRQIDDVNGEAYSLSGLGTTYFSLGQRELAMEYLQAALEAARRTNNGLTQVTVLKFIGQVRRLTGDAEGALDAHARALRLATGSMRKAQLRLQICEDLLAGGRTNEALAMLQETEAVIEAAVSPLLQADFLRMSGEARLQTGQAAEAVEAFQSAAELYEQVGLGAERSQALFGIARAAKATGHPKEAVKRAEEAIESVEQLRSRLVAPQFRAFFLAARQEYYEFLIDSLMALHGEYGEYGNDYLRRALSVSERSRARALVDLIGEAGIDLEGEDAAELTGRQEQLFRRLAQGRYQLDRLLDQPATDQSASHIQAIKQSLAGIENELNLLQIELREVNPAHASLTDPEILDAAQLQGMLDRESILLQFALGDAASHLWLVTSDAIEARALPGRQLIEQQARQLHDMLQRPAVTSDQKEALAALTARLSEQILAPAGNLPYRRVLVAADGVLHYLPFPVLLSPSGVGESASMLASHEVIHVPSLSVLAAQRKNHRDQHRPRRELAVFADPVFTPDDPRFEVSPAANRHEDNSIGGGQAPAPRLQRLPATAREARAIAELAQPEQRLLALGFDSSLEAVMAANLNDYRIIHFATHGRIDSRYPALSELVFSQYDERGQPQDGSLHLYDVYKLDLQADLVAMSACSTALGREIAGEGLTGLTQGFMYAGSRSVLASLWQVPDRATAELMTRFYRKLLSGGQTPAAALREAQLDLAAQARWRSPYFWGAFVLQGEWQ